MAVISSMVAKLTLDSSQFSTGLQRSRRLAGRLGSQIVGVSKQVLKYGSILTGVAVGGLAAITKHHLSAIDSTAKFADTIGIQTEQLIGLRHAANLSGIEQGKFDKALQRMVRNLGDAAEGTGEAKSALDLLGLSAEDLAAMRPDQQFATIADALNGVENKTQKASLAYRLFGRDGIALQKVLDLGSEGLAAQQAEAERLGLTFSRVDAAKVEQANDAMTRVKSSITGAGQSLAIGLAPFIEAAANKFLDMGVEGQSTSDLVVNGIEMLTTGIAKASDWLELLKAGFYGLRTVATGTITGIVMGVAAIADGINVVLDTKVGRGIFGDDAQIDTEFLHTFADELASSTEDSAEKAKEAWTRFSEGAAQSEVEAFFKDIRSSAEENAQAIAEAAEATRGGLMDDSAMQSLDEQVKQQEKITDTLADYRKELDQIGLNDIEIKLADLSELGATNDQLTEAREHLEAIARLKRDQERQASITSLVDDLEQEVRTFGLTEEEKKIFDLEALGASDAEIDRAKAAIEELAALRDQAVLPETEQAEANRLIRAGSAEAQRLAFQAARQATPADDIPREQLRTAGQQLSVLEQIRLQQQNGIKVLCEGEDI